MNRQGYVRQGIAAILFASVAVFTSAALVTTQAAEPATRDKAPATKGQAPATKDKKGGTRHAEKESQPAEAQVLLDKALSAEATGDTQARGEYLQQALAADPDFAPAHWQLGEMKIDGQWLSVDSAAATSTMAAKFHEYRLRRAKTRATADEQIKFAAWCSEKGLTDQARMHLQAAMSMRPTHNQQRDIMKKLDLVRYQKQLMPAAKADLYKKHDKELEALMHKWKPILTRWRGDLESRDASRQIDAEQKLNDIKDVAVIPVLETVFAKSGATAGAAAVKVIAAMPEIKASESLVRFAVLAENEEVRQAAAEALRSRDVFSYVPMLLAGLSNPIEISFQSFAGEGGIFGERLTLYREGPEANMLYTSGVTALPNFTPAVGGLTIPQTAQAEQRVAAQAAQDSVTAQAAMAENARSAWANERIIAALRIATDNDSMGEDAKDWWNWWSEYNELHYAGSPETYEINRSTYTYYGAATYYPTPSTAPAQSSSQSSQLSDSKTTPTYQPPTLNTRPGQPASTYRYGLPTNMHWDSGKIACFVPGTIVWTVTGKMPIEEVRVGDLVLSQNVETGELAYKPVERVTKGPPLPLVEIHVGQQTIRSTMGHLFWVSGTGWRMAKELKVGDRLHTTKGTLAIDSVEKTGEASCHNLVVTDFTTFFVTDEQILVHDIDVHGPTLCTVPGFSAN
ncbi:MAG TPA: polymorphic toxin-type HINT domain-containing protein [Pirellulales bacterium]|nr:polymorphic toxin-type HINT domain-containing protein [Pirellulales bacterium]